MTREAARSARVGSRASLATWALVALGVLLVAGYFGFHALFVKVSRSVEQPFSGPARHNAYYVLQRYLEERGIAVRTVRDWPQPLSSKEVVLWFSYEELPNAVREWLAAGGELWAFRDPDGDPEEDWESTPWPGEEEPDDEDAAEDEAYAEDLELSDAGQAELSEQAPDAGTAEAIQPDAGSAQGTDLASLADRVEKWCEHGCLKAAQFEYGQGRLTLVTSWALQNDQVHRGETPARIDALFGPERPSSVLIVTSLGSPWFGQLLLQHAPGALLAFAALLGFSLWRAGTHFGPKQPSPSLERRQILEHIAAAGSLAGRLGLAPLVGAARRELRQQLAKRIPHGAGLTGEAYVSAVSAATDLPAREVQRALLDEPNGTPQDALAIARAVQALWRKT
jgi:hypothetical protein